jgi:hypothetical protein
MRRRERTLSASIDISHYPVPENNYPGLLEILAKLFCCVCFRHKNAEDAYSSDSDDAVFNNDDSDDDED